jgi:predicted Zn-dependent peptidase
MSFKLTKLDNGLPIVSFQMPSVRTVSINFIVGVGSRYEIEEEEGISHFLEHMAFKGTETRSARKIAEEFDAIGGHFNAYTSKEHTVYFAKVLDIHAEKAIAILADIIFLSKYDQEDISKERDVIIQEIAQVQDNPDDLAYENLISTSFPSQPLGKSILGTKESISKFTPKTFRDFVANYYTIKNCVLSVAGNIEIDKLRLSLNNLFSNISDNSSVKPTKSEYIGGVKFLTKDVEQTNIFLGFNSSSYSDIDRFYKTQIFSLIFGGGLSSRLFQRIREEEGLAYSVGSFNSAFSDNGVFSIYAATSHDKAKIVIQKLLEEINKSVEYISQDELDRAKNQIESSILMAEEKSAFKSEEIGKNYILFKDYISPEDVMKKVKDIDVISLKEIAKSIFATKASVSIIAPEEFQIIDSNNLLKI